ncbi:MAG: GtrA family protein, partial [Thermosynechococcaceae cyanobacterium]
QYVDYVRHLLQLRLQIKPKNLSLPISLFVRFCAVGLSGVFVDMTMLYLLSDPSTLGWGLTRSKVLAAETAIVNNFLWNDTWTFSTLATQQNSKRQRLKRFLKFNLICLIGLCLNVLILNILFNALHLNRYVANLVAIGIVTIWNFLMNWKLNWRVTDIQKN